MMLPFGVGLMEGITRKESLGEVLITFDEMSTNSKLWWILKNMVDIKIRCN